MSDFKKLTKTAAVTTVFLSGWLTPAIAQATVTNDIKTIADKTLEKSEIALDVSKQKIRESKHDAKAFWAEIAIAEKVDNFQNKTLPIGNKIKKTVNPNNIPGMDAARWADKNTSMPAILMMLVTAGVLGLMALAGPSSLSGGRH